MPKPYSKKLSSEKCKPRYEPYRFKQRQVVYTPIYEVKAKSTKATECDNNSNTLKYPIERNECLHRDINDKDSDIFEVLITDFKFAPKCVKVKVNSTVKWRIDKNETVYDSGIFGSEERSFVINVNDPEHVESNLLSKDQTFSHKFEKAGSFQIHCANYPQIQGSVEVYDDKENKTASQYGTSLFEGINGSLQENLNDEATQKDLEASKDSLLLLKDFETEGIKELILDLLMNGLSEKLTKKSSENSATGEEEEEEEKQLQSLRYDLSAKKISSQKNINIYDELISQEFNGIRLKSREDEFPSPLKFKLDMENMEKEETNLEEDLEIDNMKNNDEFQKKVSFEMFDKMAKEDCWIARFPVSLKNPKDEEQQFDQALNHSQECIPEPEECEEYHECEQQSASNGDNFLEFLKEELKDCGIKRNRRRRTRRSKAKEAEEEEEKEKVDLLKSFLTNRFEFAEAFN